jgi:hypothetical protein
MKKLLILTAILVNALSVSAADSWVVMTQEQQSLVRKDACAFVAVEAAAGQVSNEIQDAGVDYPEHLYLLDLHVGLAGKTYAVTFKDDIPRLVGTKVVGKKCVAGTPERIDK